MALALSEDDKEALAELRDSPLWLLFWNKVAPSLLDAHRFKMAEATRLGDAREATYAIGRYDGVVDTLEALYRAIDPNQKMPEHVNKLKRMSSI